MPTKIAGITVLLGALSQSCAPCSFAERLANGCEEEIVMDLQEARQTLLRETPLTTSDRTPNELHEQFFERTIALFLIAVLFFACVQITVPFLRALTWATIMAISTWPLFLHLRQRLGERKN
jgi:hypothetical protein